MTAFLIDAGQGNAYILDIEAEPTLSRRSSIDSALSRGYWEPFDRDQGPVLDLAVYVAAEGDELPQVGWDQDAPAARRLPGVRVMPEDLEGLKVHATGPFEVSLAFDGTVIMGEVRGPYESPEFSMGSR